MGLVPFHVAAMMFILFIAVALGARPETSPHRPEKLALHLVASGHAQVAERQSGNARVAERHAGEHAAAAHQKQRMTSEPAGLTELAEKTAPLMTGAATTQQHRRNCTVRSLASRKFSSLLQLFNPKQDHLSVSGVEYVTETSCDSAADVFRNLIAQERHVEVICMIGGTVAACIALSLLSMWLGQALKPRPPSYWKHKAGCCFNFTNEFEEDVDVTEEYRDIVQRLVDMTTIPEKMGMGRDGSWQKHKKFKVTKVIRIENGYQWTVFATARKLISRTCDRLSVMPQAEHDRTIETLRKISETFEPREQDPVVGPFMEKLGLDSTRNEVLLFHGSPLAGARGRDGDVLFPDENNAPMHAIKRTGFDERLGNARGMLGAGTYFGDHASKADQYAGRYNDFSDERGSVGEVAAMFLARVVLGTPYMTQQSLEQLRRPPCIEGHFDCQLGTAEVQFGTPWHKKGFPLQVCDHPRYDSVISDMEIDGDKKNFHEYVLYERNCYPEFLFYYERLPAD